MERGTPAGNGLKHAPAGLAVDIGPHPLDWNDVRGFGLLAQDMIAEAARQSVRIRWGGDWDQDGRSMERGESDLVHWELVNE